MIDPKFPRHLQEMVERELKPGESVLWRAMPKPRFFTPPITLFFCIGALWTTNSILCMAGVIDSPFGQGFDLFRLVGLIVPTVFMCLPLWNRWQLVNTVYVITNRRAITFDRERKMIVRSYPREKLQDVFRRDYPDGTSDLVLDRQLENIGSEGNKMMVDRGFLRIFNTVDAQKLLESLASESKSKSTGQKQHPMRPK